MTLFPTSKGNRPWGWTDKQISANRLLFSPTCRPLCKWQYLYMKKTILGPYVEIITPRRRRRSEALSSDSSPETEVTSSNLSPTKKPRLENGTISDGLTTLAHQRLALRESPTVSEFESPISEGLRLSPTVSDLGAFNARQVSPTISDYENGNVEAALG
ncbi:hypothetical protein K435DRAFT_970981, partial [Dendrothele bispora CBS 962.96]